MKSLLADTRIGMVYPIPKRMILSLKRVKAGSFPIQRDHSSQWSPRYQFTDESPHCNGKSTLSVSKKRRKTYRRLGWLHFKTLPLSTSIPFQPSLPTTQIIQPSFHLDYQLPSIKTPNQPHFQLPTTLEIKTQSKEFPSPVAQTPPAIQEQTLNLHPFTFSNTHFIQTKKQNESHSLPANPYSYLFTATLFNNKHPTNE